jgi:hypothetical protein
MMVRISLPLAVLRSKAQTSLSQDANFPTVEIVQGLDEVLRAPAPSAQFGDQDGVNFVGSRQRQNLGALGAPVVGT